MPAGQPFTLLCQAAARPKLSGRADLHIHTTVSDGTYTPAQIVELARRSGLVAVALADHDTLAGVAPARAAAADWNLEVIAGVEISTEHEGRHLHLLGYFVDPEDAGLLAFLQQLQQQRQARFWEMVERLKHCGVSLDEEGVREQIGTASLGRRHLAQVLVQQGKASTIREAFQRWLRDGGRVPAARPALPLAQAIERVRQAGGVAALAHPSYDWTLNELARLRELGLGGIEADYPGFRPSWIRQLREWAKELGLAVTGGSDCHGPERELGAGSITADELEGLRILTR
jgi:3',5'-nucleoside bisphosphate phosphatase